MPTITLQVGQCGNQLGQQLWRLFDVQASAADGRPSSAASWALGADSEFFVERSSGSRKARCILVDTEPKVVNSLLDKYGRRLWSQSRCFVGHSGRGNNWAFGYSQLLKPRESRATAVRVGQWDASTGTEHTQDTVEARMLQDVMDGVRLEAEQCDSAPNFLMLHSLGGGTGSGLGSRLLEAVREEYPLNYLATVSVAPRSAGDSPMQSVNSVMAVSFLQTYADVVLWCNNDQLLSRATNKKGIAGLQDLNQLIAQNVVGALWPLSGAEVASTNTRIRDMVCSVASDPCLKLVEAHTAALTSTLGGQASWQDGFKALNPMLPRYDPQDSATPVVYSSALLLGRALPATALTTVSKALKPSPTSRHAKPSVTVPSGGAAPAVAGFIAAVGGAASFACPADAAESVQCRCGSAPLAAAAPAAAKPAPALTCVANTSAVIGPLDWLSQKARTLCDAGAYMHWYERYGCSKEAINEALHTVEDMADAYRLACGIRDSL